MDSGVWRKFHDAVTTMAYSSQGLARRLADAWDHVRFGGIQESDLPEEFRAQYRSVDAALSIRPSGGPGPYDGAHHQSAKAMPLPALEATARDFVELFEALDHHWRRDIDNTELDPS